MNFKDIFKYTPSRDYSFTLKAVNSNNVTEHDSEKKISGSYDLDLNYIKNKYSSLINSDIEIREFSLTARDTRI